MKAGAVAVALRPALPCPKTHVDVDTLAELSRKLRLLELAVEGMNHEGGALSGEDHERPYDVIWWAVWELCQLVTQVVEETAPPAGAVAGEEG